MPELAGEPWDTGVMLYGEFWLAGERDASLGTLRPFSVEQDIIIRRFIMVKLFSLFNNQLASPSWDAGSRERSSVKCRHSSPCSSWLGDSRSTLGFPFFPSRSFNIIYRNTEQLKIRVHSFYFCEDVSTSPRLWTFFRGVGRLTLGISLSFPLLTRGAVESRELCGAEYCCWWPFNMDDTLAELWNGAAVPTRKDSERTCRRC